MFDTGRASLDPAYRPECARYLAQARTQMEPSTFEMVWTEGRALTLEQSIAFALAED